MYLYMDLFLKEYVEISMTGFEHPVKTDCYNILLKSVWWEYCYDVYQDKKAPC